MLRDPSLHVEEAIQKAIQNLQGDREMIRDWYGNYPAARQNEIIRFFETWSITKETVKPAFAKEERTLPTISVLPSEGMETDWSVGGSNGVDDPRDDGRSRDQQSSTWSVGCEITVFGLSREHALFLLLLVIGAMLSYRDDFDRLGFNNMALKYGRLTPDNGQTIAAFAYRYTVTVNFETYMVVPKYYNDTPTAIVDGGNTPTPFFFDYTGEEAVVDEETLPGYSY